MSSLDYPRWLPPFSVSQRCSFATGTGATQERSVPLKTHYEVLGVPVSASQAEIKKAFICKSKECHPDVNPKRTELHELFVQLNEAYIILGSPASRQQYDQALKSPPSMWSHTGSHSTGNPFGGVPKYREETTRYEYWNQNQYSQHRDYSFTVNVNHSRRRQYNKYVMLGVFVFMVSGAGVSFFVLRNRHENYKEQIQKSNQAATQAYLQARERAITNGTKKQLELLLAKHAQNEQENDT